MHKSQYKFAEKTKQMWSDKIKIAKNKNCKKIKKDANDMAQKRAFVKFILKLPLLYNSIDRYV